MSAPPLTVGVFAHNEERHISMCLDSILAAEPGRRFDVYVMANGCSDRTEDIVREYGRRHPGMHLVSIPIGDKCNAWNVYVHETLPALCAGLEIYFFMDGDARVVPGSFSAMERALRAKPRAHAASAVPASGRSADRAKREFMRQYGLHGNLYALRGSFVTRLQALSVRMPLRMEGDDGLIGALVKWDLAPERNETDDERVVPCKDASFQFESLSPLRLRDWIRYWARAIRYGRRRYEFQLLDPTLRQGGVAALPADITELYALSTGLRLRWQGIYTLTNWIALRRMQRLAKG
jgi:glycosyltransferase involved in cell wall biosynthesis